MFKFFSTLSRMVLIAGVLVALTPCGVCHRVEAAKACSMKSMSGKMNCCHKGQQPSPLCKAMDQSTTVESAKALDAVPAPSLVPVVAPAFLVAAVVVSPAVAVDTSPFRAPLSLRI